MMMVITNIEELRSDLIAIECTASKGRMILAKVDVEPGTVLTCEQTPLVFTPYETHILRTCDMCMRYFKGKKKSYLHKCLRCNKAASCKHCLPDFEAFHDEETCEALRLINVKHCDEENIHEAYATFVVRFLRKCALKTLSLETCLKFYEANPNARKNVQGRINLATFIKLTMVSNCELVTVEEIAKIFALCQTNVFSCSSDAERHTPFAMALFGGFASFFNHSCYPNAARLVPCNFENGLQLVALKKIAKGEEITIRYSAESNKDIAFDYGFNCTCEKCAQDNEVVSPFNCVNGKCEGLLVYIEQDLLRCNTCMERFNLNQMNNAEKKSQLKRLLGLVSV